MSGKTITRWRRVVLGQFDEAMLSLALADSFTHMRIVCGTCDLRDPALDERLDLAQTDKAAPVVEVLFPSPRWKPKFLASQEAHTHYTLANKPRHSIFYRRGGWMSEASFGDEPHWSFALPTPTCGDFIIEYDRKNEGDRAFVRDVWKILNRLTTNIMKSELPHLGVVYSDKVRAGTWAGHHILEWCQEVPDRMIDGRLRPVDGWVAPNTAWHRELSERVMKKYGATFGIPTSRACM